MLLGKCLFLRLRSKLCVNGKISDLGMITEWPVIISLYFSKLVCLLTFFLIWRNGKLPCSQVLM